MPVASRAMIASVLRQLGQNIPEDDELDEVIRVALTDVKRELGHDPEAIKYKVVVPIDVDWIRQFED